MGQLGEKLRDTVFQAEKRSQGNKEIGAWAVLHNRKKHGWSMVTADKDLR